LFHYSGARADRRSAGTPEESIIVSRNAATFAARRNIDNVVTVSARCRTVNGTSYWTKAQSSRYRVT